MTLLLWELVEAFDGIKPLLLFIVVKEQASPNKIMGRNSKNGPQRCKYLMHRA